MSEESSPSRLRAKLMGARGEAVLQRAPDLQRHLNNTGVSSDTLLAGGNAALANLLTMDGCPTVNLGASQEEWEKELLEVGNFCRELMPVAKYLNAFSTCQSISQRTDDAALDDFKAAVARFMEDTPFHVAQQNGDGRLLVSYTYSLPIAKHLLEAEGVKEALAAAPNTLAWLAQTGVNSDIIKACMEAGAALTNDAPESDSALSAVFNNYTDPDFLKFVLSKAQPEHLNYPRPPTYWTIVEAMIRNGNYDRALLLAEAGADIFAEGTWSALTETVTDMTFVSQFLSLDGVRKQIEPKLPCLIGYIAEKYNQCLSDEWIAALKNAGANVNETMEDCQKQGIDRPAVATFARFGYVAPLRKMIELGADVVNTKYDYGGNLLFHAAYDDMVDFLLNLGLDSKAKNSCGTTPVLQALANFWAPAWRRLIPLADVSTVNASEQTMLHLAAVCGIDATRQVLELEGSRSIVNAKDANGNTPLLVACSQGAYEVSLALLEVGAQVQVTANDGTSPLLAASLHPELVKLLIAHGAELNARDTSGRTALWKAASMASDIEVLKALLAAGARCDIPGESDESILAAYAGGDLPLDHHVYLRILDGSDRVDAQALLKLVRYCTRSDAFEPTYRELVKRGLITHNTADSDANVVGHFFRRTDNNEALIIALTGDLLQAAKQAGELDQVLTAVVGKDSVLHYAAYRGSDYSDPFNNHFKAMLTAAPHLVNAARSTDGRTPLHCAVGGNNKGAVQVLLELGANPSLRDANGQTAGDLASSNSDIASLLLESQP